MDAPVLNYSNILTEFYWGAISGADTYFIYADGEIYDSTTETNYSATSIPNGSVIYITAYNSGTKEESTASNTITFYSSLSAPYISIGGTTISWSAISGADYYRIYLNDSVYISSQSGTTYNFGSGVLETGDKIYVIAANSLMGIFSSQSNNIYYNVVAPDAPVIDLTDLTVSWSSVSGADSYKIYVNSAYYTATSNLYYTFSSLTDGDNINVTSYSNYELESSFSNTETYSEEPTPTTTNKIIHRRRLIN